MNESVAITAAQLGVRRLLTNRCFPSLLLSCSSSVWLQWSVSSSLQWFYLVPTNTTLASANSCFFYRFVFISRHEAKKPLGKRTCSSQDNILGWFLFFSFSGSELIPGGSCWFIVSGSCECSVILSGCVSFLSTSSFVTHTVTL